MPAAKRAASPRPTAHRVPAAYTRIRFGSRATVARSLASVRMGSLKVAPMLDAARGESVARANQLAVGLIAKKKKVSEERDALRDMMRWAAVQSSDAEARRRIVMRAYKTNKREILAIHGISEMTPAEAALFMRSYFDEGGSMKAVTEWLQAAGRAMQPQPAPLPARRATRTARRTTASRKATAAGLGDWFSDAAGAVGDFFSDAGNAVGDAVSTVVNAVLSAGKTLAEAVAAAASWTVSQITDVVRALIAAGKSVAAILGEALNKGAAVMKKFVEALVAAGRSIGEILTWATAKAASVIRDAVAALLSAGRTVYQVLAWAGGAAAALAQKVMQALRDVGKTIAQLMADIVRMAAVTAKKLVAALYAITQALGDILVSIAQSAASVIRTVLEGLLAIGVTLANTVAAIVTRVAEAFRRGLFEGLIALGKTPLEILKAALVAGASVLVLAFAVMMEIFGGHRAMTSAEVSAARKVFGWSIDLNRVKIAVASIPADVANWLNGQRPFTTMYVINFASNAHITMGTLIHELTHVWQGVVAGPVYMVEALHSQFFGRGYNVTSADIAAANGDIRKLEREQQAVVVERYYEGKWGDGGWDPAVYEQLAKGVYTPMPVRVTPVTRLLPNMLPLPSRASRRVAALPINAYN